MDAKKEILNVQKTLDGVVDSLDKLKNYYENQGLIDLSVNIHSSTMGIIEQMINLDFIYKHIEEEIDGKSGSNDQGESG